MLLIMVPFTTLLLSLIGHTKCFLIFYTLNLNTLGSLLVDAMEIKTFFLNKDHDFRNSLCNTCSEIECVFAEGDYSIPDEISICARTKAKTNVYYPEAWSAALGLGIMSEDGSVIDQEYNSSLGLSSC